MSDLNPIDVHVGKRLRFARTMHGMSQEAIGEAIGVTFQQIQKYERGVNCIRASRLYNLAKALKVSVSFFYEGYEDEDENSNYAIPGAADSGDGGFEFDYNNISSRESIEFMRAYHQMTDPALRSRVLDLIRAMADNKAMVG